ncbi:hypothetical protein ACVWZV_008965 [Bradyrhizobium sp. GM5.1]
MWSQNRGPFQSTDAFNHGGTPEFAPISAFALRHNEISQILSTTPSQFEPMHRRKANGDVDPRPWCQGPSAWAPLLDASNGNHGLLLPILLHCRDDQGRPLLGPPRSGRENRDSCDTDQHRDRIPSARSLEIRGVQTKILDLHLMAKLHGSRWQIFQDEWFCNHA